MFYPDDWPREWADVLNDWKCGGRDCEEEKPRATYPLGTRLKVYEFGRITGIIVVTPENLQEIERNMNDPENDVTHYEAI